jgi:hypothetical protein
VLGIARRTPGLTDLVADHRHNGMVAQSPFARAVIIDDVTNPWLALLHEESPGKAFQTGGMGVL